MNPDQNTDPSWPLVLKTQTSVSGTERGAGHLMLESLALLSATLVNNEINNTHVSVQCPSATNIGCS